MGYIYMIRNKLNDKKYIGKTLDTIEQRWKDHCHDYKRERCEKRPLYNAMNKYGLDAFEVIEIEEVDNSIINEREEYWIAYYNTYLGDGYNATKGGDGKQLYNYKEIANKYLELGTVRDTASFFKCDPDTVKKALNEYNIEIKSSQTIAKERYGKTINRCDLETHKILEQYQSYKDAGKWVYAQGNLTKAKNAANIGRMISDKLSRGNHNFYGYYWELA